MTTWASRVNNKAAFRKFTIRYAPDLTFLTVQEAIQRWFLYRVIIGLTPIAAKALAFSFLKISYRFIDLFHGGELLLIICAICAGGIGELLSSEKLYPKRRQLAAWGCVVTVLMAAIGYGFIILVKTAPAQLGISIPYDSDFVPYYSIFIYVVGLLSAFGCVVLVELAKLKRSQS